MAVQSAVAVGEAIGEAVALPPLQPTIKDEVRASATSRRLGFIRESYSQQANSYNQLDAGAECCTDGNHHWYECKSKVATDGANRAEKLPREGVVGDTGLEPVTSRM